MVTLREYAKNEGITIGAAYLRVWNGRVKSEKRDGRIYVISESQDTNNHNGAEHQAELETA